MSLGLDLDLRILVRSNVSCQLRFASLAKVNSQNRKTGGMFTLFPQSYPPHACSLSNGVISNTVLHVIKLNECYISQKTTNLPLTTSLVTSRSVCLLPQCQGRVVVSSVAVRGRGGMGRNLSSRCPRLKYSNLSGA